MALFVVLVVVLTCYLLFFFFSFFLPQRLPAVSLPLPRLNLPRERKEESKEETRVERERGSKIPIRIFVSFPFLFFWKRRGERRL